MTSRARGTFDVTLRPETPTAGAQETGLRRKSIDKRFRGDLEGTSQGEMLSALTGVEGSASYVAIEKVRGTLRGRRGTFVLQHTGVMTRGAPELVIRVVPDSGTDELTGLSGTMTIEVGEKHAYDLEYSLPDAP